MDIIAFDMFNGAEFILLNVIFHETLNPMPNLLTSGSTLIN